MCTRSFCLPLISQRISVAKHSQCILPERINIEFLFVSVRVRVTTVTTGISLALADSLQLDALYDSSVVSGVYETLPKQQTMP